MCNEVVGVARVRHSCCLNTQCTVLSPGSSVEATTLILFTDESAAAAIFFVFVYLKINDAKFYFDQQPMWH